MFCPALKQKTPGEPGVFCALCDECVIEIDPLP